MCLFTSGMLPATCTAASRLKQSSLLLHPQPATVAVTATDGLALTPPPAATASVLENNNISGQVPAAWGSMRSAVVL